MKQKQEKLETKMKWMLLSTMIPMTILIIVLLVFFWHYTNEYNQLSNNLAVSSEYNANYRNSNNDMSFKDEVDMDIYYVTIGRKGKDGLPTEQVDKAISTVESLKKTTSKKESLRSLKYLTNYLENLKKRMNQLLEIKNYQERQEFVANNTEILTTLFEKEMQNYIYQEATEEIEIRTTTDEEGNEEEYEYRILNVKLTNKPIASLAEELLNPQQFEMFKVYLQTQGNKPLIFGGGSPDGSPSEDLSGVEFVNGTRPGNPELMELAKQQVGNVGGYPYWSWYGFNSRVEWCACFVSWCYNQAGKSEPRFAGCEWQGVPWFQSRGQWGARGYENIAPGDAIFFDWDLDGVADHVGLVLGRDGSRVYTVEGNSGDACKIKSYDLNYQCIKGYGLMNW